MDVGGDCLPPVQVSSGAAGRGIRATGVDADTGASVTAVKVAAEALQSLMCSMLDLATDKATGSGIRA
ncbi:hypothetical protein GCM10009872_14540 [Actinopolymorpha rutila]